MSAIPKGTGKNQLTDVKTLREQARRHIEEGAVTENYTGNREKVLQLLNEALATEMICVMRYRHNYYMAKGPDSKSAADEFLEHANEELQHACSVKMRWARREGRVFGGLECASKSRIDYVHNRREPASRPTAHFRGVTRG